MAAQAKARATAEDVQRLLGRARAQQAAPASARGEGGAAESNEAAAAAEESEAQQEGEDPADTVDERIKRRCAHIPPLQPGPTGCMSFPVLSRSVRRR